MLIFRTRYPRPWMDLFCLCHLTDQRACWELRCSSPICRQRSLVLQIHSIWQIVFKLLTLNPSTAAVKPKNPFNQSARQNTLVITQSKIRSTPYIVICKIQLAVFNTHLFHKYRYVKKMLEPLWFMTKNPSNISNIKKKNDLVNRKNYQNLFPSSVYTQRRQH